MSTETTSSSMDVAGAAGVGGSGSTGGIGNASAAAATSSSSIATTSSGAEVHVQIQELQETVSRLSSHKGVEMVLILNRNGDIVAESSGGNTTKNHNMNPSDHAKNLNKIMDTANKYFKILQGDNDTNDERDGDDEISFVQIRSKCNRELMIAPHHGYVLAVLKR